MNIIVNLVNGTVTVIRTAADQAKLAQATREATQAHAS